MQNLIKPNDPQLEGAVLGAIMIEKEAINHVIEIIKDADIFYSESNKHVFRAIMRLYKDAEAIDMLTVIDQLRKNKTYKKVGGAENASYYISQLTIQVNSAAHITTHARILVEKYMKRVAIDKLNSISTDCYNDGDAFKVTDNIQQLAIFLSELVNTGKGYETYKELIGQVIDYLEEKRKGGKEDDLIITDLTNLDKIIKSFKGGESIVLGGSTGMGKTATIISIIDNMGIRRSKKVLVFSLEMQSVELMKRVCASECEIPLEKMETGDMTNDEWGRLIEHTAQIANSNISINDNGGLTIIELKSQISKYIIQNKGLDVVVIDYLQLMKGDGKKSREREIGEISTAIKAIAKEFNIVMITLAQCSRSVSNRGGDMRPKLQDLRDSGQIEQDADRVLFVYRPEYYDILEDEDGNSTFQLIKIIVAKNRHGKVGDADCRFIGQYTKVTNWENEADSFSENLSYDIPLPTSTEFDTI